jgi:iron-sulfur cluster assembly protein
MAVTLTPSAAQRVRQYMVGEQGGIGLRFGVRKTGCSGWAYTVDVATSANDSDAVFEQDDLKVVIDRQALPLLDGTEIDFARQGLNRVFVFKNPNVAGECGCGESFSVERAAI